jgi:hypothetical protein
MYSILDLLCAIGASATLAAAITGVREQTDRFSVLFARTQRRLITRRTIAATVKLNIFQCRIWIIASKITVRYATSTILRTSRSSFGSAFTRVTCWFSINVSWTMWSCLYHTYARTLRYAWSLSHSHTRICHSARRGQVSSFCFSDSEMYDENHVGS